ncbi:MAG: hypothetical protein OXK73_01750 [Rhodospirillaceae bacterium]|nr:hypothetical protein [Rhodospirillaceae bacterium]
MGAGPTETLDTPDYLAEAGIERVSDDPMDDQTFDIRTKHGTLASIPYTVEPNDIPMMIIRRNSGGTRS